MTDSNVSKVLTWPDMVPDTTLQVFKTTYHVHSVILKLHSRYFSKFMDSPDKSATTTTGKWRYEYVTQVDAPSLIDDGESGSTWGLEAKSKANDAFDIEAVNHKINIEKETKAFDSILCAMYTIPYDIENQEHFQALTRLADFYCALPIVSSSILAAFFRSSHFVREIPNNLELNLSLAYKLRQPHLYKECLIYMVGYQYGNEKRLWDNLEFETKTLLLSKTLELHNRVSRVMCRVFDLKTWGQKFDVNQLFGIETTQFESKALALAKSWRISSSTTPSTSFIRAIRDIETCSQQQWFVKLHADLTGLLKNNLVFDILIGTNSTTVGLQGPFRGLFLCTSMSNDEFPWDINETIW